MAGEKNTPATDVVENAAAAPSKTFNLSDVYADYADSASKDASKEVLINLLDKIDVEFIADFKNIKKGTKLTAISRVAFDLYNKNGVVKLIKEVNGPTDADLDKEENS